MTERRFNIISELKFSKTSITLITIAAALITFLLPISLLIIIPSDITAGISGTIFIAMLIIIKPIENHWLHKTRIIGEAIISDECIMLNETRINWNEITDIKIERYINLGRATTVSYWKDSYKIELKKNDNSKYVSLLSKKTIDEDKVDLLKVLITINQIDFKIRKNLKKKMH